MTPELRRAMDFGRRMQERLSTRTEPFTWGTAFFDDRYSDRYYSNLLWVTRPLDGVTAADLAVETDRLQAGLDHRLVCIDDDDEGEGLRRGFEAVGYRAVHSVTMVHRREPDRGSGRLPVEEVDWPTLRPVVEESFRGEPSGGDEDVIRSLADHGRLRGEIIGARYFAARAEGGIASFCYLFVDGDDAQVEDVYTLEAFRGRGLAREVILRAVTEARAAGCGFVFIGADEEDWPKHLYGKLGFDPVGRSWEFLRWPDERPPSSVM